MSMAHEASIDADCCVGCSQCRMVCPTGAISRSGARYAVEAARCVRCGKCVWFCPVQCIAETRLPEQGQ